MRRSRGAAQNIEFYELPGLAMTDIDGWLSGHFQKPPDKANGTATSCWRMSQSGWEAERMRDRGIERFGGMLMTCCMIKPNGTPNPSYVQPIFEKHNEKRCYHRLELLEVHRKRIETTAYD